MEASVDATHPVDREFLDEQLLVQKIIGDRVGIDCGAGHDLVFVHIRQSICRTDRRQDPGSPSVFRERHGISDKSVNVGPQPIPVPLTARRDTADPGKARAQTGWDTRIGLIDVPVSWPATESFHMLVVRGEFLVRIGGYRSTTGKKATPKVSLRGPRGGSRAWSVDG